MKIRRKIILLIVTFIFVLSTSISAFANVSTESKHEYMDDLDKLLIAHKYMSSETDIDLWKGIDSLREIINLYDLDDNVIAYYISFSPKGYTIVNNNLDNPIAIEFGDGKNHSIDKLVKSSEYKANASHIVYAGPGYSFIKEEVISGNSLEGKEAIKQKLKLDKLYAQLNTKNEKEMKLHQESRTIVKEKNNDLVGGSGSVYNNISWGSMPSGSYTSGNIPFSGTTWAVMSDYDAIASNHCGATAATNISLYYANRGYTNLKKNNSVYDTFVDLHNRTGDGPVMMIAPSVKSYASSRGYSITSSDVGTFSALKTATSNSRPCGVLVTGGVTEWHWVVSTGWREYTSGGKYIRVVTGWENSANNFYLWGNPSVWSMSQYYMQ